MLRVREIGGVESMGSKGLIDQRGKLGRFARDADRTNLASRLDAGDLLFDVTEVSYYR